MALYNRLTSSLIRFIEDFRKANLPDATYVDWDAHADVTTLPPGDLCGPAGMGFSQEDASLPMVFSFGVCTVDDTNLFRLRKVMGLLHEQLQPQTLIPIYDETGVETEHWIIIKTPVIVNPISKAQVRTIQFITLQGLVDFGALKAS